jgi:FkbM family methyltransferase
MPFYSRYTAVVEKKRINSNIVELFEKTPVSEDDEKIRSIIDCIKNDKAYNDAWFQSASFQDVVAYLYFYGKKDGFYMDIGANDGLTLSNTYLFEQLGWKGACIEPQPDIFAQLQKNRKCDAYNAAVSNQAGDNMEFVKVNGSGIANMLSGLPAYLGKSRTKQIEKIEKEGTIEYIKIKTMTFDDVMKNYPGITHIDFLSLDVEGGEMHILKSIDFEKYHFALMTIENNERDDNTLTEFMREKGYNVFMNLDMDLVFVPSSPPAAPGTGV